MPLSACFHVHKKRGFSQLGPSQGQLSESPLSQITSFGAARNAHNFAKFSPQKGKFYLIQAKLVGRKPTKYGHGNGLYIVDKDLVNKELP